MYVQQLLEHRLEVEWSRLQSSLLRRGFNELYMALTISNRCVEDAQAETGKAGSETSARSRSKKC